MRKMPGDWWFHWGPHGATPGNSKCIEAVGEQTMPRCSTCNARDVWCPCVPRPHRCSHLVTHHLVIQHGSVVRCRPWAGMPPLQHPTLQRCCASGKQASWSRSLIEGFHMKTIPRGCCWSPGCVAIPPCGAVAVRQGYLATPSRHDCLK